MTAWHFTVPGKPAPQSRHRSRRLPGGKLQHYNPRKGGSAVYRLRVAQFAGQVIPEPTDQPVELCVSFGLPIPASWPAWKRELAAQGVVVPTTKPDLDNLEKAVKDALKGIAWLDDAQVVRVQKGKHYAAAPELCVSVIPRTDLLPAQVSRRPLG